MNALTDEPLLDLGATSSTRSSRATARSTTRSPRTCRSRHIRGARNYLGDRLIRAAQPHRLLDPEAGPLIAVRLHILTRKTLGGLETDLSGRVLRRRRPAAAGTLRGGRGRGLRRRRHARLPLAGGHFPRRLHLLGPHGGAGSGRAGYLRRVSRGNSVSSSLAAGFGVEAGDGFEEPPLPELIALAVILGYVPYGTR